MYSLWFMAATWVAGAPLAPPYAYPQGNPAAAARPQGGSPYHTSAYQPITPVNQKAAPTAPPAAPLQVAPAPAPAPADVNPAPTASVELPQSAAPAAPVQVEIAPPALMPGQVYIQAEPPAQLPVQVTAPAYRQPMTVTVQRPSYTLAQTVSDKVGHEHDYSWITGYLYYVHSHGGQWVLRYADLDRVDRHGGSVVLAPAVEMTNYREGDLVKVHGELLGEGRAMPSLGGALYRVQMIEMVERR